MFKSVFVVTDLGPGDGGKGSIVHALAQKLDASVIIKRGGAQGSHGVRTSNGESYNFSQWGCGTFDAIPSYLSSQMVIMPVGLENESNDLKRLGIYDPYVLISADPSCIVATPFHRIASRIEELLRKDCPRGTVGTGVGQAVRMHNTGNDELTIRASELSDRVVLTKKLSGQLEFFRDKYIMVGYGDVLVEDKDSLMKNLDLLFDDGYLPYIISLFEMVGEKLQLKTLKDVFKEYDGETAIVECSHGVLTDAETGLKPHVSALRTLPEFTTKMLRAEGYFRPIYNLAVHRAYEIRHGAGPMPTYDTDFTANMLPDSHKQENRWQGKVRVGALDINLMRYALSACSNTKFDGICLTWFDQVLNYGRDWRICSHYKNSPQRREPFVQFLERAEPDVQHYLIRPSITGRELFEAVNCYVKEFLNTPLEMLSVGPTEDYKIYSTDYEGGMIDEQRI